MTRRAIILLIGLACSTAAYAQQPAGEKKETVKIYHPEADAKADIAAAVSRAGKLKKHVFLQIGGNWCPWCLAFHQLVESTPALQSYLNDHYETVLVNYSKENKNEAVMAGLGFPGRFGYPVFVILEAASCYILKILLILKKEKATAQKKSPHF